MYINVDFYESKSPVVDMKDMKCFSTWLEELFEEETFPQSIEYDCGPYNKKQLDLVFTL